MKPDDLISSFLKSIRARLSRHRLLSAFIGSLAVAAAALLVICLTYVLRGHAVPLTAYWIAGGAALIGGLAVWIARRPSASTSAAFGDQFFGLKDAVGSYLRFHDEGREGELYGLQAETTAARVSNLDPSEVRYEWPKRLLAGTAVVLASAVLLGFKPASPEVLEKMRVEAETEAKTEEINEHLEELIEELEKAAAEDEELAELDRDALRKWVDELKNTTDRKEAMRQYAELERRLQQAAQRLDQRRDEQLLAKVGEELKKDQETRELGKKLEQKDFREAAEDVEAMKPGKIDPKKLTEQKKELAKLKAAAQRMAAAAKAANRQGASNQQQSAGKQKGSQTKSGQNAQKGQGQQAQGAKGTPSGEGQAGESLQELMAQLDQSVKDLEQAMKEAELAQQLDQDMQEKMGECQQCQGKVAENLDKLAKSLCKAGAKCESQAKLQALCQSLGQCQSYLNGQKFQSLAQCLSAGKGGKKAGVGSVESRRDQTDPLVDNGNTTQLQGIKGQGPSVATVEAADDGDGVSVRRAEARAREFQNQLESFVQREDVPEDVKEGVKEYFRNIHRINEAEPTQ